jgi:hypothetical protein
MQDSNLLQDNELDKEILEELEITYNSWKQCFDNHLIIQNENDKNIVFNNLNKRNSIIFSNCNNSHINIKNKINHVILENCKNIILILNNVLISRS